MPKKKKHRKKRVGAKKKTRKRRRVSGKGHMKWGSVKSHRRRVAKPKRRKRRRTGELVNVTHRVKKVGARKRRKKKHSRVGAIHPHGMLMRTIHQISH